MEKQPTTAPDSDVEANKTAAALAYLWILCLVILFFKRDSKFSHFHAKQGLLLFAIEIIIGFATFIPFVNIIWLPVLILAAIGIYRALDGQMKPLPFIGHYAERINI